MLKGRVRNDGKSEIRQPLLGGGRGDNKNQLFSSRPKSIILP